MAPLLAALGLGGATAGAADAGLGALGAGGASGGLLGAGAGGDAAAGAAGGLSSAQGGNFLSDFLGPVMKGLTGGGAPALPQTGAPGGDTGGGVATNLATGGAPPAGGGSPGLLSSIGTGLSNAATSFFQPPAGGSIWQSPFGQYLLARHGIGGMGQPQSPMNPMLTAALQSGIGRMVQPAYSASGMGNPFTFNPAGPQFQ